MAMAAVRAVRALRAVKVKSTSIISSFSRHYHVKGEFPVDPNDIPVYFKTHHSAKLSDLYKDKKYYPKKMISQDDFSYGYAHFPKPFKLDFIEFLKIQGVIVEDERSAYPAGWRLPKVSELKRPIMTLVRHQLEEGWTHSFSAFWRVPYGATGYLLLGKNVRIYENFEESTRDEFEGQANGLRRVLQEALAEGIPKIYGHSNSKELVDQVLGVTEENPKWASRIREILDLFDKFKDSRFEFVYQELNQVAVHLARQRSKNGQRMSSSRRPMETDELKNLIKRVEDNKVEFVLKFK